MNLCLKSPFLLPAAEATNCSLQTLAPLLGVDIKCQMTVWPGLQFPIHYLPCSFNALGGIMYSVECGQGLMCPSWPKEVQEKGTSASCIFFHLFVASWGHQGSLEKPRRLQDVNQINPEWLHGAYPSTAAEKFGIYSCWVPEILGVSGTAVTFSLTSTQPNLPLF